MNSNSRFHLSMVTSFGWFRRNITWVVMYVKNGSRRRIPMLEVCLSCIFGLTLALPRFEIQMTAIIEMRREKNSVGLDSI